MQIKKHQIIPTMHYVAINEEGPQFCLNPAIMNDDGVKRAFSEDFNEDVTSIEIIPDKNFILKVNITISDVKEEFLLVPVSYYDREIKIKPMEPLDSPRMVIICDILAKKMLLNGKEDATTSLKDLEVKDIEELRGIQEEITRHYNNKKKLSS